MEIFSLKRITIALLIATLLFLMPIFLSPLLSGRSTDPCSPCHFGYYQYLDILEEEPTNQIPQKIDVNETKTVSVTFQNIVNTDTYSTLTNIKITLSSSNGHFSVNLPTIGFNTMPPVKRTVSWQITGTSEGCDYITISATAHNTHESVSFSDNYTPHAQITIGNPPETPPPTSTPTPTTAPTPTPTPTTAPTTTPTPTQTPTLTPTPTTAPTPTPTPTPTTSPSQNSTETPELLLLPITAATTIASAFVIGAVLFKWKKNGRRKKNESKAQKPYSGLPKNPNRCPIK